MSIEAIDTNYEGYDVMPAEELETGELNGREVKEKKDPEAAVISDVAKENLEEDEAASEPKPLTEKVITEGEAGEVSANV